MDNVIKMLNEEWDILENKIDYLDDDINNAREEIDQLVLRKNSLKEAQEEIMQAICKLEEDEC